ncbi:MAG: hypothetical protein U1F63_11735 [Chitinivorax sp.]
MSEPENSWKFRPSLCGSLVWWQTSSQCGNLCQIAPSFQDGYFFPDGGACSAIFQSASNVFVDMVELRNFLGDRWRPQVVKAQIENPQFGVGIAPDAATAVGRQAAQNACFVATEISRDCLKYF